MRALRDAYSVANQIDNKSLYLFMFAGGDTENKLQGDMPLKSKFGYSFNAKESKAESTARTIAHELGHGFFELRHTFSKKYNVKQGTTDNLMDYNNGEELVKYQWDVLHDPQKRVFDWAQGEDEGKMLANMPNFFGQKVTTPIGSIQGIHEDAVPIQDNNDYTIAFITPDEKVFMWINEGEWQGYFEDGEKNKNQKLFILC